METFELAEFALQSGPTLRVAQLAYQTYGRLNATKSNAILVSHVLRRRSTPTSSGLSGRTAFSIRRDTSSSSSTCSATGCRHRRATLGDSSAATPARVHARRQRHRPAPAAGRCFRHRAAGPGLWLVDGRRSRPCTGARCIPSGSSGSRPSAARPKRRRHNLVFLEGIRAALTADPAWNGRRFTARPERGLRAMGRVYAGLGPVAGVLSREAVISSSVTSRSKIFWCAIGRPASCGATPRTCCR